MKELIISHYINLDEFVDDLIRLEELIDQWEHAHPGYYGEIVSEITEDKKLCRYKITVLCKRPSGK
jgi:hypothetical protein